MIWPPLSEFTAVSSKTALTDVPAGSTVFAQREAGKPIGKPIGEPMGITVPQYALHHDEQSGVQTPCVIIQAEQARGQQLLGACMLPDRSHVVGLAREFELLGTTPPADR